MLEGTENERDMPGEAEDPPEEDVGGGVQGRKGVTRRVTLRGAGLQHWSTRFRQVTCVTRV